MMYISLSKTYGNFNKPRLTQVWWAGFIHLTFHKLQQAPTVGERG